MDKTLKIVTTAAAMMLMAACSNAGAESNGALQTASEPAVSSESTGTPSNAGTASNTDGSASSNIHVTATTAAGQATQAEINKFIDATVSPQVMAGASGSSQCSTQVSAVQTLVQNFVQQIESSNTTPTMSDLKSFFQQLEPALQAVVTCYCGSNSACTNVGQSINANVLNANFIP